MQRLVSTIVPDKRFEELREGLEIVALRRLGDLDDARDAAQECLSRLIERISRGFAPPAEELAPVAYGILRHIVGDLLRERKRVAAVATELPHEGADALALLVSAEERQALSTAIASLDTPDRELLQRCFVDGDGIGSIARALGEPPARLRKRKSRALARLREAMRTAAAGHNLAPGTMRAS